VKRARYSIQWKDEGTVAVEIEGAAFKLSSRRLAKESDYFRERFDKGTDIVDSNGLSVYVVNKEEVAVEVRDFDALLAMMDDAMFVTDDSLFFIDSCCFFRDFIHNGEEDPPLETTASILRASTSLSFGRFRAWAIRQLEHISPADLDDIPITQSLQNPVSIVELGINCDVPSILKRSMYEVACMTVEQIIAINKKSINRSDINDILVTRDKLAQEWAKYAQYTPFQDMSQCTNKECNSPSRSRSNNAYNRVFLMSGQHKAHANNPLRGIDALCTMAWEGWVLQSMCARGESALEEGTEGHLGQAR
jgi:hypothetical protein